MVKTHATSRLLAITLALLACSAMAIRPLEDAHSPPGRSLLDVGQYDVRKTYFSSPHSLVVLTPSARNGTEPTGRETYPAIIFAHGLCGPVGDYEAILEAIAGQGFIVVANREQLRCGPSWRQLFTFNPFGNLKAAANGGVMVENLRKEVDFLLNWNQTPAFDGERIGLVGHSMGGGAVIDLAAKLASSHPGIVKAVAAIAPWNGINNADRPSSVAHKINAPLLLICSKNDQICPCNGMVGAATGVGYSLPSRMMLGAVFEGNDGRWFGGVDAIYDDALKNQERNNVTIERFHKGGHFAMAGISREAVIRLGESWGQPRWMASMGTAFAEIKDGSNPFPEVKSLVTTFLDKNVK
uniref:Chlorophyllase n=2 Tax=Chloropicon primus TaxID=1764295 RepID=A0A7S2T1B5_9CHLO|mmetsp:Transcript_3057/g.8323  ORF Transcript_3057/g.8323 Transcript_3057/m.8323 type:complete len:354 (+) Transcript_3057:1822-2883(+)